MKTITFVDGTTLSVGDASTATNIIVAVSDFATIDDIRGKFSAANTRTFKLGDETYHNMVPTGVNVPVVEIGEIPTAVFSFREKSQEEITSERLDEVEQAINAILMG